MRHADIYLEAAEAVHRAYEQRLLEPADHASKFASVYDPFRAVENTEETMNHRVFLLLLAANFEGWDEPCVP